MEGDHKKTTDCSVSRREFVGVVLAGGAASSAVLPAEAQASHASASSVRRARTPGPGNRFESIRIQAFP